MVEREINRCGDYEWRLQSDFTDNNRLLLYIRRLRFIIVVNTVSLPYYNMFNSRRRLRDHIKFDRNILLVRPSPRQDYWSETIFNFKLIIVILDWTNMFFLRSTCILIRFYIRPVRHDLGGTKIKKIKIV